MAQSLQRVNARPQQAGHENRRPRSLTVIQGGLSASPQQQSAQRLSSAPEQEQAALLSKADPSAKAQIVGNMQHTHGNAHVQRFLSVNQRPVPKAPATQVQRCGSGGCGGGEQMMEGLQRTETIEFAAPVQRSVAPTPIIHLQRCGGKACNCSPTERATHGAEKIDEGLRRLSSIDFAGEIQRATTGNALHPIARTKLEPAMGLDLSAVTVHHDAHSDSLARAVDAEAFTTGSHIFFREGRYDPHSPAGLRLLAHEITHTSQQGRGAVSGPQNFGSVSVNEPGDIHEQEAERNADEALRHILSPSPNSHGGPSPANTTRRSIAAASGNATIQRTPTIDNGQGLNATWTPFASLQAPPFNQTTNFDTDGFHEEFNVPPKASGRLIMLADVAWKKTQSGPTPPGPLPPGPLPGPLPPIPVPPEALKACDACEKLPPIAPQADLDSCFRLPDLCSRRAVAQALLSKYTKDPCELISTTGNTFEVIAKTAAKIACKAGVIAFKATGLGAVIFEGLDALRQGLQDLDSAVCTALGCAPIKPTPGPGPNPTPLPPAQEGKGRATFETRFFVGVDGEIQVVGLPPRVSASGSGAELVSPIEFIRTPIPGGVNIAFQPMLKGTTAGETNVFQHQWDVDIIKPAPPAPVPFKFGTRLFPFKTGKEFFEDEGATQAKLLSFFQTMDPRVFSRIENRQQPVGVIGHASHLGDPAFNLSLSEKRAKRVQQMVSDFGGSFAGVVTFAFGELLAGGDKNDNSGLFRRADVGVCGQLTGPEAAAGPIIEPADNDQTLCASIGPKTPAVAGSESPAQATGNDFEF